MSTHWSDRLVTLGACSDAVDWARTQPTYAAAWKACERGDWLLWLAAKVSGKRGSAAHKQVVLAACACAETALKHVPVGEDRPAQAIQTARAWVRGTTTLEEVSAASAAAAAASADAYAASAAAAAAYAAAANAANADAANAAAAYAAAANAANADAANAAAAYAAADTAYAYTDAQTAARKRLATIVRRLIPRSTLPRNRTGAA